MADSKTDRRIERTRTAILQAFLSLCSEKSYDKVSVIDIAERANIGRTTFYDHYTDKEDLLTSSIAEMFMGLTQGEEDPRDRVVPAFGLLNHIKDNAQLTPGFDLSFMSAIFQENVAQIAQKQLRRSGLKGLELQVASQVITGGLVALVIWWIRQDRSIEATAVGNEFYEAFNHLQKALVRNN